MRQELIGLGGIVERNIYLVKRYILWDLAFMVWTIANTLTIVFIARAVHLSPARENELATKLLVGAVIWAFLGIIFEFVTETVAWERWEGTIEYTFMAPLSRTMHLFGQAAFAVLYGLIRATILFFVVAAFIGIHMPNANFLAAFGAARDRVDLVHGDRDDDVGAAAHLAGEGRAARLRRAGDDARRLRRVLPGVGDARLDAGDREGLARDVRAARRPRGGRRRRRHRAGPTSGPC